MPVDVCGAWQKCRAVGDTANNNTDDNDNDNDNGNDNNNKQLYLRVAHNSNHWKTSGPRINIYRIKGWCVKN